MFACRPNYIARYWRALNRRIPTELEYLLETAKKECDVGFARTQINIKKGGF